MVEVAAVAAGGRTGSSAGLAKSLWRDIGRRLSGHRTSYVADLTARRAAIAARSLTSARRF
jgi:hypothetical protein